MCVLLFVLFYGRLFHLYINNKPKNVNITVPHMNPKLPPAAWGGGALPGLRRRRERLRDLRLAGSCGTLRVFWLGVLGLGDLGIRV